MAIACVAIFVDPVSADIIVAENFGGDNSALNGTTADTFDAAITSAGGSNTWGAHPTFIQSDGDVDSANNDGAAFLTLGTYIEDAKGTATGLMAPTHLGTSSIEGPARITASWICSVG